jgi:hypothetical protein
MGFGPATKYWRVDSSSFNFKKIGGQQSDTVSASTSSLSPSSSLPTEEGLQSVALVGPALSSSHTEEAWWIDQWDRAIEDASNHYDHEMHNLFCNNCHSHVALALNALHFRGITRWNTALLILYMAWYGKFVSKPRFFQTYLGFFILAALIIGVIIFVRVATVHAVGGR